MNKSMMKSNQALWDELTEVHLKGSDTYPIDAFRKGEIVLHDIEKKEIGDVTGKSLLHLQCHFGMDTLSWARLGAKVTGVDFSEKAIEAAKGLSKELDIQARFLRCDIMNLPGCLKGKFDIVFASYGALYWISDITKWCRIAAHYLKRGGFLYIIDGHPFYNWLNRDPSVTDLAKYKYSYFDRAAQRYENPPDYATSDFRAESVEYGWQYTVGDLINSIAAAGLRIDFFNEFPSFNISVWKPIGDNSLIPTMFSVKASRK